MFPVIDMHCDTISCLNDFKEEQVPGLHLRKNGMHIDLERMKKADYMCQSFALFTSLGEVRSRNVSPFVHAQALSDTFDREIELNKDIIAPVTTATQIEENFSKGMMSALKTVEEGAVYEGDVSKLEYFYSKGVRKSTLTWNFENELAYPNPMINMGNHKYVCDAPDTVHGLKPAGFEMVHAMEDMGVVIDVSHLNDAGIWDILKTVRPSTPVIASHSNARGLMNHLRNLTDDMIRAMADHGGITGINFLGGFLSPYGAENKVSRIQDMVAHAKYICNVGGIDFIALGTDFDGIGGDLEVNGCGEMQKLAEALLDAGFSNDDVEKIFYRNALRVYHTVLG